MTDTPLGPGQEFDRIRAIEAALGGTGPGLGDDCAFLPDEWCASTDVSTEGVHFRRAWLAPREIGWRAAMAALSDLAAVGAEPVGVLAAVTAPKDEPAGSLAAIMGGVGAACEASGTRVVGGDLSAGPGLSIAVTVLGKVARPVRRTGARPGDGVWVTGALGGARAALADLLAGRVPSPKLRARFAAPRARIREGRWLAEHGATAMIDLSDGLGGDAAHLAVASGVGLAIDLDLVPADPAITAAEPWRLAALGGEDYELLVTMPEGFGAAGEMLRTTGTSLTRVGVATAPSAVHFTRRGAAVALAGYDHFA